jgi:CheY-like chemotaxis protein
MSPPPRRDERQRVSVLVVDDDVDIRETVIEVLADAGYEVASAGNGAEALDALRTVSPDLILLDLSMPVMSGEQFRTRQLREPKLAGIPVVVMSAAARLEEKTAGMKASALLAKPVKLSDLLAAVGQFTQPRV